MRSGLGDTVTKVFHTRKLLITPDEHVKRRIFIVAHNKLYTVEIGFHLTKCHQFSIAMPSFKSTFTDIFYEKFSTSALPPR